MDIFSLSYLTITILNVSILITLGNMITMKEILMISFPHFYILLFTFDIGWTNKIECINIAIDLKLSKRDESTPTIYHDWKKETQHLVKWNDLPSKYLTDQK